MEMDYKYWSWFAMMILDFMILNLQQKLNQKKKNNNKLHKKIYKCLCHN